MGNLTTEQELVSLMKLLYEEVLTIRSQMDDVHALFKPRPSVKMSKKEIDTQRREKKKAEFLARLITKP